MTEVVKVDKETMEKMIDYYEGMKREKTPPYAIFQADDGGNVVTLYESGKAMFQGKTADVDAKMWSSMGVQMMKEIEDDIIKDSIAEYTDFYAVSSVGSDEVGTGDFFGPIVVSAAFISEESINKLIELGVKDSKKMNDELILKIVPKLLPLVEYESLILSNKEYNEKHSSDVNMNKIKAIMHNKVLFNLTNRVSDYEYIVVDQFAKEKKYYEYLTSINDVVRGITFLTKGEDKSIAVAAASLISRYLFIKEFDKLSDSIGIPLPKGAGDLVDKAGVEVIEKFGEEKLKDIAKLNFKNLDKIKSAI